MDGHIAKPFGFEDILRVLGEAPSNPDLNPCICWLFCGHAACTFTMLLLVIQVIVTMSAHSHLNDMTTSSVGSLPENRKATGIWFQPQ